MVPLNRKERRKLLADTNERLRLNGQPEVTMRELKNMESFKEAMRMEHERLDRRRKVRKKTVIGIITAITSSVAYALTARGGFLDNFLSNLFK